MAIPTAKSFNLPYLQSDCYWVSLFFAANSIPPNLMQDLATALKNLGYNQISESSFSCKTSKNWLEIWGKSYELLKKLELVNSTQVSLSDDGAASNERKPASAIQEIAENSWLGEALLDNRMMSYFQPIVSEKNKIFGYESFVRARAADGVIIGGDKIIRASKALNIEYMMDRHLHVQSVQTFASSDFSGFLFVNFFSGFIHRPAVYLEGLSEAVKLFGIIPKNLVLELTSGETARDMKQLKSICEYARSQGYSVAIDDITTLDSVKKLIGEIRPDFVKLDSRAIGSLDNISVRDTIRQIVELVHSVGSTVIAESVETEEGYMTLKNLGVDLFQGYYFSAPAPATAIKDKSSALAN